MLIALAFAYFSSKLLLKEQMIIPVKKTTLNNAGHIDAKLSDFSEICPKKSSEIGRFLLIVSWRSFPPKFPVKSADFSKDFSPENPAKFCFFPRNTRSPVMIMIMIILLLLWHIKSVKFILLQSMLNSTISRHYNLFTLEVGKFFFCFFF